jgi:hypothetical protein
LEAVIDEEALVMEDIDPEGEKIRIYGFNGLEAVGVDPTKG